MGHSGIEREIMAGNRRFIGRMKKSDPAFFLTHAAHQTPKLLWIGCSDSRVPEAAVTDTQPGEIFVHRNIANIVAYNDVNIAAVVEYAVEHLHIPDIIVCGHYGCGGIRALVEHNIDEDYIADWLHIAARAVERAEEIHGRPDGTRGHDAFLRRVVEENVKLQISHLDHFALVERNRKAGRALRIHGCVYDVRNGRLRFLS